MGIYARNGDFKKEGGGCVLGWVVNWGADLSWKVGLGDQIYVLGGGFGL